MGIMLRHQNSGRPVTAADIGHLAAYLKFGIDALQCRYPLLQQISIVAGLKKSVRATEQATVMIPLGPTLTRAKNIHRFFVLGKLADDALKATLHACWIAFPCKDGSLLRGKTEQFDLRLVGHVAKGGVRRQPLEKIALVQAAFVSQLISGARAGFFQRPVNAGLISDVGEQNIQRPGCVTKHFSG